VPKRTEALRLRVSAVRRQVLARMYEKTLAWRLAWFVPFNGVVFAVIWSQSNHALAALVQATTLVAAVVVAIASARVRASVWPFFIHAVHWAVGVSLTGGLASPLVPMGLPILASASVVLETRVAKLLVLGTFALATTLLALAAGHVAWTAMPLVLAPYALVVRAGSLLFSLVAVVRIGLFVTEAYTELAMELAARREEAFAEGEDYARSLEGVAARLAHEVKNPLAAIKGLSTHMARGASDEKTAERLGIVAQEADRLQAIVDGFLGFTRGLDDLRLAHVVPYDVAKELVLLLEMRAAEMGVAIEVMGDERAAVVADTRKIRQALLNVVLNAMQASPRGSKVTIAVARASPDVLRMRVVDRGSGMKPAVVDRVQKPYFTTRAGGSGLGLAITRAIVEQHGGKLTIESAEGKGTTVTIELPEEGPPAGETARLPGVSAG
jgi:signal transduction histidine kinase